MKSLVGIAVACVLSVGAAHASVVVPGPGQGELIEWVVDNNNGHVYARGTQISETTILPAAQIQPSASYNEAAEPTPVTGVSFTIAPDANLTTFLAQGSGHDSFSFGLMAAGSRPTTPIKALQPGGYIDIFTSTNTVAAGNLTPYGTSSLQQLFTSRGSDYNTVNSVIGGTAGDGKSADVSDHFTSTDPFSLDYGQLVPTLSALGTSMNLYAQTGNTSQVGNAQLYTAGLVTMLADGTLKTVAATSPVPLPAALWLLGSGLVGLAGVGRRRAVAVA